MELQYMMFLHVANAFKNEAFLETEDSDFE